MVIRTCLVCSRLVWALVVQTKDFAAFLSAHPGVLAIVQDQRSSRGTQDPPGYRGHDRVSGLPTEPDDNVAARGTSDHGHVAEPSRRLSGENCTVFLTDVVEFGARIRTDTDRRIIREALFRMTRAALTGMPDAWSEDRGDGQLTIVPPSVPTAKVIDQLLGSLPAALERHDSTHHDSARFQLRLAVNVGPVASDDMGVSGEAIIVAARLVGARSFKDALTGSSANLGLIASPFVYETVIRHRRNPGYSQVQVEVKESEGTAWMKLFGARPPTPLVLHPDGTEYHVGPLIRATGCYLRMCSRSRQDCSQRRQASVQTRQCGMWECRSHSSPQLLQTAMQDSTSGRTTGGSYTVNRLRTAAVAVQTSTQSRHSRMHVTISARSGSVRSAAVSALQAWAQSPSASMAAASTSGSMSAVRGKVSSICLA
ncbi:MAG TPA: hypothetical protein VIY52_02640 [Streptosporangiaceae bacterium]